MLHGVAGFFFEHGRGAVKLTLGSQRELEWSVDCKPRSCGWSVLPVMQKEYEKGMVSPFSLSISES